MIDRTELTKRFRAHVAYNFKTQKKAATHYGVSRQYMSDVHSGKSPPNEQMLLEMGLERKEIFIEVEQEN